MRKILWLAALAWWALTTCVLPVGAAEHKLLVLNNGLVKWGEPVLGTAASITYAFADARTATRGARNCGVMTPLSDLAAAAKISMNAIRDQVREAFRSWEAVASLSFREADHPDEADIVIGAQAISLGRAFTNVALADAPQGLAAKAAFRPKGDQILTDGRVNKISQSLICLNPAESWKIGFDGNLASYDLRYTLMHEIGHAIGLDHPGAAGELMDFRYDEKVRTLQPGDVEAVQKLYGPRLKTAAKNHPVM